VERQTGKAVLEDRDVVVAGRQFGRTARVDSRGKRIILRRQQEGPILPVGGINDPLLQKWMAPETDIDHSGFSIWTGHRVDFRRGPTVYPKGGVRQA
jgi:hypothetical protein